MKTQAKNNVTQYNFNACLTAVAIGFHSFSAQATNWNQTNPLDSVTQQETTNTYNKSLIPENLAKVLKWDRNGIPSPPLLGNAGPFINTLFNETEPTPDKLYR
ncbi:hypothetical protein [Pseudomonas azotoformans]|uniref:hypothetical protein n=1 Tax=Pseudomonas azotoformans TaxID=47878 RepID=UPI000A591734|nr:hypothetical protein [Pseudomonas azotoformans]